MKTLLLIVTVAFLLTGCGNVLSKPKARPYSHPVMSANAMAPDYTQSPVVGMPHF